MLRILIVEDAPNIRGRLRKLLGGEEGGYCLAEAGTVREAREVLSAWQPNLLLLDLAIPSKPRANDATWRHGRDLLRHVKKHTPHVKVIVLTSHGELARDFLLDEGADDFFTKDAAEVWQNGQLNIQVSVQIGHLACASPATRALRQRLDELTEGDRVVVLEGPLGAGKRHLASVLHRNSRAAHLELRTANLMGATAADIARALLGSTARVGALGEENVGNLLLVGVEQAQPSALEVLTDLCRRLSREELTLPSGRPACFPGRLMIAVKGNLSQARDEGTVSDELFQTLYPGIGGVGTLLAMPTLAERSEDIPLLVEHFARETAVAQDKVVSSVHPGLAHVVSQCSDISSVAQLRQLLMTAVGACDGSELLPSRLPLELPERYLVVFNDGSGRQERKVAETELLEYADPSRFDLVVFLERDANDSLTLRSLTSKRVPVEIEDSRLVRLLVLLLRNAGERVDLKAAKRRLGIGAAEPMKRFLFELRKALNDPVIEKTRSHYLTGHWGEACTFHGDVAFALVTELRRQAAESDE